MTPRPPLPAKANLGILPASSAFKAPQQRSGRGTQREDFDALARGWRAWLIALALAAAGRAQDGFPNHPVRVVIPYSAGSVADVFGRIVTQNMAAQWNGSIILESKSGANGSIAAEDVARAAPDGYTWLLVTTFFTTSPSLNITLRWDPVRDFIPVGQICQAPNFFIVPTSLPVKNVAEYVALARAKPGHPELQPSGQGVDGASGV